MNAKMNARMNFVLMNDLLNGTPFNNPEIKTNFSTSWNFACECLMPATIKLFFVIFNQPIKLRVQERARRVDMGAKHLN